MNEVMKALSVSAGILLGVVVLTVLISIVAVKRGAASMKEDAKGGARH